MSVATSGAGWPEFSFAFQPIVDIRSGLACSHEALVRGLGGEGAMHVLSRVPPADAVAFDGACRAKAIAVAAAVGVDTDLNLNALPSAMLDQRHGLSSTLEAATRHGFPIERLVIEATEDEAIADQGRFARLVNQHRRAGAQLAIDDFGAGYSGLILLSEFQPDIVKLDMRLVRGIETHGPRQAIVRAIIQVCADLGIELVVEGVETVDEFAWFVDHRVFLFQGYLFARPAFEAMPSFAIPALPRAGRAG